MKKSSLSNYSYIRLNICIRFPYCKKKKKLETALKPTTRETEEFLASFADKTNNLLDKIPYKVKYMYIMCIIVTCIPCIELLPRVLIQRNLSRVNEPSQIRDKRQEGRTRYGAGEGWEGAVARKGDARRGEKG